MTAVRNQLCAWRRLPHAKRMRRRLHPQRLAWVAMVSIGLISNGRSYIKIREQIINEVNLAMQLNSKEES